MKKMMNALSILLMMFAFGFSSITACAGEISQSEVITYTEVKISATVPEGFNEDIIITLEESVTLVRGGVVLSAENGYASSTRVIGGNIYNTYVRYGNNGDWKCDIAKQYEVPNGVSVEFSITVTDGSIANNVLTEEQPEQSQPVSGTTETPHSEDIDPLTNLLKGEVAVQNFIDKTSFIQNDESYQGWDFLGLYSGDGLKKDYLDSHSNNTEEQWNAMTEYEKFVWRKVYLSPNLYMFKAKDLNDFMEDVLATEISLFKNNEYTDEDAVYDALVELYEWHYSYFLVTGTVYDYYNGAEYVLDTETQTIEEINPYTNLIKGEVAIQNFINKITFIQNDATYQGNNFLSLYSSASKKELYLKSNPANTNDKWESMTELERFIWAKSFYEPNNYLYKNAEKIGTDYSVNDFLADAICVEKGLFDTIEYTDEKIVYDALVELCEWHYSYFLATGTIYDYYNGTEYMPNEEKQEVVKLEETKKEPTEELTELREDILAELTDEEKEELGISTPTKTSPILPITIVALCIIIAVIAFLFIRKQKK